LVAKKISALFSKKGSIARRFVYNQVMRYRIRKSFTDGLLKGMEFSDYSSVPFIVGKTYKSAMTSSVFTVLECEEVTF
jgi:hypothetical protein